MSNFNQVAARMMNSSPYGDSLTASYFGSQAQLWGDQAINSVGTALYTEPEAIISQGNQNQREKLWSQVGKAKKPTRLCGGANCPPPDAGPTVNLQISRAGDVSMTDRSIDIAAPNIPGFNFPEMSAPGGGGGGPTFIDVAGDRYSKDDATPVGFWDDVTDLFNRALTGKADCKAVCEKNGGPPDAIAACIKDCEQSNTKNDFFGAGGGMTMIILVVVGIVLLAAGLNTLTRG